MNAGVIRRFNMMTKKVRKRSAAGLGQGGRAGACQRSGNTKSRPHRRIARAERKATVRRASPNRGGAIACRDKQGVELKIGNAMIAVGGLSEPGAEFYRVQK